MRDFFSTSSLTSLHERFNWLSKLVLPLLVGAFGAFKAPTVALAMAGGGGVKGPVVPMKK